jgi:RNA polymerase sigma factor (sigma-70 family)
MTTPDELFHGHLYVARSAARRHPSWVTADEAHAEALVWLWRAARTYDPAHHGRFAGYALWRCRQGVYCYARRCFLGGGRRPTFIGTEGWLGVSLARLGRPVTAEPAWLRRLADRDQVDALLRRLSPRDRHMARLYWLGGLTQAEVAATLGLAPSTVGDRLRRALAELRAFATADRPAPGPGACESPW